MTDPYTPESGTRLTDDPVGSTVSPLESYGSTGSTGSYGSTDPYGSTGSTGSTTDVAKSEGKRVAGDAAEGGKHVANVAANEASSVASEAKDQARSLLGQAGSELSTQAGQQKDNLVSWLRTVADELGSMADSTRQSSEGAEGQSAQSGVAANLAERGADYAHRTASWLGDREPRAVFDEIGSFARRRPGAFMLLAAAGGIIVGRLTRGLAAGSSDDDEYGNGYADDSYVGQRRLVTPDVPVLQQDVTPEPLSGDGFPTAADEWPATTSVAGDRDPFESTTYPESSRYPEAGR
jgi:hypothetical protein